MISQLISRIKNTPNCTLLPPAGLPIIENGEILPEDVRQFFTMCGGGIIFTDSSYPWEILPAEKIKSTCINVLGEKLNDPVLKDFKTIVHDGNGDYLSINFGKERNGIVIDSFHETFGLVGNTPIIAISFIEFLEKLIANNGKYPFWLESQFKSYGDLFD